MEEKVNRKRLISLLEKYDSFTIIGNEAEAKYIGIVSCVIDGISSDSAADIFASRGVSVRAGLQCAPRAHLFLGTYPAGTIRFSVNCFNKEDDFNKLEEVLDSIEQYI